MDFLIDRIVQAKCVSCHGNAGFCKNNSYTESSVTFETFYDYYMSESLNMFLHIFKVSLIWSLQNLGLLLLIYLTILSKEYQPAYIDVLFSCFYISLYIVPYFCAHSFHLTSFCTYVSIKNRKIYSNFEYNNLCVFVCFCLII